MKRKQRRLLFVLFGLTALGAATALVLLAFEDSLVFFYSPSDIVERQVEPGRRIRVGGLVEEGSVVRNRPGGTHGLVNDGDAPLRLFVVEVAS